jgi:hypothetical protein
MRRPWIWKGFLDQWMPREQGLSLRPKNGVKNEAIQSCDFFNSGLEMNELEEALLRVCEYLQTSEKYLSESVGEEASEKGMSVLSAKYAVLMNYCADLCGYMRMKLTGSAIDISEQTIERLIEGRVVIEKLRPIEAKLKFQIDRLLQTSHMEVQPRSGHDDSCEHALLHRPNPRNLASVQSVVKDEHHGAIDATGSVSDEGGLVRDDKDGLYRPPRVAPMHFEDRSGRDGRTKRRDELARKKLASSALVRQLREEYSERPTELDERSLFHVSGAGRPDNGPEDERAFGDSTMEAGQKRRQRKVRLRTMADELEDLFDVHYSDEEDPDLLRLGKRMKTGRKLQRSQKGRSGRSSDAEEIVSSEDF